MRFPINKSLVAVLFQIQNQNHRPVQPGTRPPALSPPFSCMFSLPFSPFTFIVKVVGSSQNSILLLYLWFNFP